MLWQGATFGTYKLGVHAINQRGGTKHANQSVRTTKLSTGQWDSRPHSSQAKTENCQILRGQSRCRTSISRIALQNLIGTVHTIHIGWRGACPMARNRRQGYCRSCGVLAGSTGFCEGLTKLGCGITNSKKSKKYETSAHGVLMLYTNDKKI